MVNITEVFIGESTVLVECENGDQYRVQKQGEKLVESLDEDVPEAVREKLEAEGFTINEFPREFSFYLHDDASRHDYQTVSEKTGLPEDHSLVERIAGIGYEIELKIRIENERKAYVTHFMGKELVEPKKI
jgi:hypothetical protein